METEKYKITLTSPLAQVCLDLAEALDAIIKRSSNYLNPHVDIEATAIGLVLTLTHEGNFDNQKEKIEAELEQLRIINKELGYKLGCHERLQRQISKEESTLDKIKELLGCDDGW
jgi:hypothetical protein